jgi:hypothetical protein
VPKKQPDLAVRSLAEFYEEILKYKKKKVYWFRGQADASWELVPRVGREPYRGVDDKAVFTAWKRRAIEYVTIRPETEWDWLALAQHHGLATRLLDWTTNPFCAAYFAVREAIEVDSAVCVARFKSEVLVEKVAPFDYQGAAVFRPRGIAPRIPRQSSVFSIQSEPAVPLESRRDLVPELCKILIPPECRAEFLSALSFVGFNAATLFPDLDGLSAFLNWTVESREYWKPFGGLPDGAV